MSFVKKIVKSVTKNVVPAAAGAGAGFLIGGPAGAAIGAGAGFGLGYLQDQQTRAQNKANQKAVDRANAYDMYTWDLANRYNSPSAQVQRLIDAGFNPYTQGAVSAGNASGVASSNGVASQSVADKAGLSMQLAQQGLNLATTKQQLDNMSTQGDILKSQFNQMPTEFAIEQGLKNVQTQIMQHNLDWAEEHNLPVNQVPDWQRDAWNRFTGFLGSNYNDTGRDIGHKSQFVKS